MKLQAAMQAVQRGFHIFPVSPGLKVPHPAASYRDAAGRLHGWGETATNDPSRVIHFWTNVGPAANIGVACKPSQLLVIDLDKAKEDGNLRKTEWAYMHDVYGPRVDGEDLFDEMMFKAGVGSLRTVDTYTVRTGSGGLHLYYWWPSHWPKISQASPVKGVMDVRGNGGEFGGYVLGAGSVTGSGGYTEENASNIQLAPDWIRKLVVERPPLPRVKGPLAIQQPHPVSWAGLIDSVRNAGEGNRNNALLWAARCMYSDHATVQACKDTLGPAAQQAGLPWYEIERTIESAYQIQQQKEG